MDDTTKDAETPTPRFEAPDIDLSALWRFEIRGEGTVTWDTPDGLPPRDAAAAGTDAEND